jgi:hypothetical protein
VGSAATDRGCDPAASSVGIAITWTVAPGVAVGCGAGAATDGTKAMAAAVIVATPAVRQERTVLFMATSGQVGVGVLLNLRARKPH